VTVYMNQLAKSAPHQFRLVRDAARWGVVEDQGDTVFYVLWPPWSPHRPELPGTLVRLPPPRLQEAEGEGGGAEPVLRRAATEARGLMEVGIRGLW